MDVFVKQGELQLLHSGIVHIAENESTKITLDNQFNIFFQYNDTDDDTDQKLGMVPLEHGVMLILTNFKNQLGSSTIKPIEIATTQDKTIYISFSIVEIGTSKVMSFGLYSDDR